MADIIDIQLNELRNREFGPLCNDLLNPACVETSVPSSVVPLLGETISARGLDANDLAVILGVDTDTISRWLDATGLGRDKHFCFIDESGMVGYKLHPLLLIARVNTLKRAAGEKEFIAPRYVYSINFDFFKEIKNYTGDNV